MSYLNKILDINAGLFGLVVEAMKLPLIQWVSGMALALHTLESMESIESEESVEIFTPFPIINITDGADAVMHTYALSEEGVALICLIICSAVFVWIIRFIVHEPT